MEHGESHLHGSVGEFTPILENLAKMLILFGEAKFMGIVLEGYDQKKLKYLTAIKWLPCRHSTTLLRQPGCGSLKRRKASELAMW